MAGIRLPAPAEPEKFLRLNYGPKWQIPDAGFIFPWPEAHRKFTRQQSSYKKQVYLYAMTRKLFG